MHFTFFLRSPTLRENRPLDGLRQYLDFFSSSLLLQGPRGCQHYTLRRNEDEHVSISAHRGEKERNTISYRKFNIGSLIVTVTDTGGDRFNMIMIYRRPALANRSWMQKQTPAEIMDKVICVFAEYRVAYATVITQQLGPFLTSNKLQATGIGGASIMGFSAGGYPTLDAYRPTRRASLA